MREIRLSNGMCAVVDDADYEWLSLYKWNACVHYNGRAYATTNRGPDGHPARMHRLILTADPGMDIDHIDGNGLNNQRANLRTATRSQNNANKRPHKGRRYKGVFRVSKKESSRWKASIRKDGKTYHVGVYDTEEDAARAYDTSARAMFGEYARLNFPECDEVEVRSVI